MITKFYILDVGVSVINMDVACSFIDEAVVKRHNIYICVCPVSTIMECKKDKRVLTSVNAADLVTPDGMPVVWLGKMRGYKNIRRVYGPDLMREICAISTKKGYTHFFYGSTPEVLNKLKAKIVDEYPGLIISGMFSPPFRKLSAEEDGKIIEGINSSNSDIVWVGLGSPKQDLWMYEHRDKINAPVMIGVGAAFDFLAGIKPQAPRWIRDNGFEWLFRLITEPKRLWRRYLVDCPLFVFYVFKDSIMKALFRSKKGTSR
jgi:N-acetylglucosaminyldiphosphoundecaprenol N-acetyl-beta-D-mannosaminyltransferase